METLNIAASNSMVVAFCAFSDQLDLRVATLSVNVKGLPNIRLRLDMRDSLENFLIEE